MFYHYLFFSYLGTFQNTLGKQKFFSKNIKLAPTNFLRVLWIAMVGLNYLFLCFSFNQLTYLVFHDNQIFIWWPTWYCYCCLQFYTLEWKVLRMETLSFVLCLSSTGYISGTLYLTSVRNTYPGWRISHMLSFSATKAASPVVSDLQGGDRWHWEGRPLSSSTWKKERMSQVYLPSIRKAWMEITYTQDSCFAQQRFLFLQSLSDSCTLPSTETQSHLKWLRW